MLCTIKLCTRDLRSLSFRELHIFYEVNYENTAGFIAESCDNITKETLKTEEVGWDSKIQFFKSSI
jgi:hypothetical protein